MTKSCRWAGLASCCEVMEIRPRAGRLSGGDEGLAGEEAKAGWGGGRGWGWGPG